MPELLPFVLCQARVEHFETAEPELIPISWCNGYPDRIVFRPLAMIREGCFKHCLWDYARVPYVVCRYDTPRGGENRG